MKSKHKQLVKYRDVKTTCVLVIACICLWFLIPIAVTLVTSPNPKTKAKLAITLAEGFITTDICEGVTLVINDGVPRLLLNNCGINISTQYMAKGVEILNEESN